MYVCFVLFCYVYRTLLVPNAACVQTSQDPKGDQQNPVYEEIAEPIGDLLASAMLLRSNINTTSCPAYACTVHGLVGNQIPAER